MSVVAASLKKTIQSLLLTLIWDRDVTGGALPMGAADAHVVGSEDGVSNGMFQGGAPLFAAGWEGKTGLSELPPSFDPKKPGFPDWSGWSRTVKVDLPAR